MVQLAGSRLKAGIQGRERLLLIDCLWVKGGSHGASLALMYRWVPVRRAADEWVCDAGWDEVGCEEDGSWVEVDGPPCCISLVLVAPLP